MSVPTKGIYILLVQLDRTKDIQTGKRKFHLEKGYYGYVGSALSGLEHRLSRHLRTDKRFHWHIDYMLNTARIKDVVCGETVESKECTLAEILSQKLPAINGFGSSDCKCPSHLFYCHDQDHLKNLVFDAFKRLKLPFFKLVG